MDKIIEKAKELKSSLNETKEFKEYLRLKELYDSNDEIASLRIQLIKNKNNKEQYEKILKEYNSHPLVVNYQTSLKEVESILRVVKDIIEKWFM